MRAIAIENLKGGVGKTVTTISLAHILTENYGKKVLVVDCDGQCNLTRFYLGEVPDTTTLAEVLEGNHEPYWLDNVIEVKPRLMLLPASQNLYRLDLAALRRGRTDRGYEILQYLLPENHELKRYGAEPFVLPADVYTAPDRRGEAGWTWYTGSAGWYFRVVTEELLGLKLREGKLYIEPNLPSAMPSYSVTWIDRQSHLHRIDCDRGRLYVDGDPYLGRGIG